MTLAIPETDRKSVAEGLQGALVDLIDLALQSKQAHWNVQGPNFRPIHLQLDEIVADVRNWSDEVAERITAIDIPADGRPSTIGETSGLQPIDEGWLTDQQVVEVIEDRLGTAARNIRTRMEPMEPLDIVSHDLLIGIVHGLEKHQWMVRSQFKS